MPHNSLGELPVDASQRFERPEVGMRKPIGHEATDVPIRLAQQHGLSPSTGCQRGRDAGGSAAIDQHLGLDGANSLLRMDDLRRRKVDGQQPQQQNHRTQHDVTFIETESSG